MLNTLKEKMRHCTDCILCKTRNNVVFGEGNNNKPKIMFIGEGPGEDEDKCGKPFVGKAGKKLNEMISYINLKREDLYITNTVLCRPPNNRNPNITEIKACRQRLAEQILIIQPQLIVLLGKIAVSSALGYEFNGTLKQFMDDFITIEVQGTKFKAAVVAHPSYHLRNPGQARKLTQNMWKRIKRFVDEQ